MDVGAATHPGYVRAGNEDGFFSSAALGVFAVADGMGGHAHGEVASHLALDVIARRAEELAHAGPTDLPTLLHDVMQEANTAILTHPSAQDDGARMGTTLIVCTIHGDRLYFAHIGDSRLYLLRGDVFTQLTRDHSHVQLLVERGEITPEEAAIHPLRHQITRVVGGDTHISPEIASQALEPGDELLLCTDGLSGAITAAALRACMNATGAPQDKVHALLQAALDAGGPDNVTALVIHFQRPRPPLPPPPPPPARHLWATVGLVAVGIGLLLGLIAAWACTHPYYAIALDSAGHLRLYREWPLGGLRDREQLALPGMGVLTRDDVRPYLARYAVNAGETTWRIPVPSREAGEALMRELTALTVAHLLEVAKTALEAGDRRQAQDALARARALHVDPQLIHQLERQLVPRSPRPPSPAGE
jgi:serine/threonine protein phosphatase PrpC